MSFDVAAEAYDRFMGRYSRRSPSSSSKARRLPPEGRALDVGCGPGALTEQLAARFGETEVAGVDPSESFVAAAAARHPWADIRHGVAEHLPFDDGTFTATLAELVVHFMTDAAAGAREMVRVTRPGGVVAACVWDFAGERGLRAGSTPRSGPSSQALTTSPGCVGAHAESWPRCCAAPAAWRSRSRSSP